MTEQTHTFTVRGRLDLAVLVAPAGRLRTAETELVLAQQRKVLNEDLLPILNSLGASLNIDGEGATVPALDIAPVEELKRSEGEVAAVVKLEVLSATVKRNPIGEADTFSISVDWSALPVDPRAYEGAQFALWLYTHDDIGRCKPGDPGNYGGIVDKVVRDRRRKTVDFQCRDWTAIALDEEISADDLASVSLDIPLHRVVANILFYMPNNTGWEVLPRGRVALGIVPSIALADERTKKAKFRKQTEYEMSPEADAAAKLVVAGLTDEKRFQSVPLAFPQSVHDQTQLDNPMVRAALSAKGLDEELTLKAASAIAAGGLEELHSVKGALIPGQVTVKVSNARKYSVPTKATELFKGGALKAWKAIVRVCALMGAAPEVAITSDGNVVVVIVDVADLAAGNVIRTFERGGARGTIRKHRVLTEGESIGKAFTESRDLAGGRKIDFVSINSPNPDTGRILGPVEHGRPRQQGQSKRKGYFLTVPGITSEAHLAQIARATYYDIVAGELRVKVGTPNPWTDGGDATDPDLLYCGAGAMLEIRFAGFEEGTQGEFGVPKSLDEILRAQGMAEEPARILAAAQERARTVPLFQVLRHTLQFSGEGDGAFASVLELQTYVGAVDPPSTTVPRKVAAAKVETFEGLGDAG